MSDYHPVSPGRDITSSSPPWDDTRWPPDPALRTVPGGHSTPRTQVVSEPAVRVPLLPGGDSAASYTANTPPQQERKKRATDHHGFPPQSGPLDYDRSPWHIHKRAKSTSASASASDGGIISPAGSPIPSPSETPPPFPGMATAASTPASIASDLSAASAASAATTVVPAQPKPQLELQPQPQPQHVRQLPSHGSRSDVTPVAPERASIARNNSAASQSRDSPATVNSQSGRQPALSPRKFEFQPSPASPAPNASPRSRQRQGHSSQARPSGQPKPGASATNTVIRPQGSGSSFSPTARSHGPSHLPPVSSTSASFTPQPFKQHSSASAPAPASASAGQPGFAPTLAAPASAAMVVPASSFHAHAASPAIIKSSSPATMPKIAGRGNPPGRAGTAFPSPPSSIGGPAALPQRMNSFPSAPPDQQPATSPGRRAQRYPGIESQPKTRPISLTQLVNEVKGIYVGLAMVESKCIEIDNEQSANNDPNNKLDDDQWQALLALHRTLLHEHHDFMLASQHPSASPALRRVAQKYAMPARMWRHGIHSFLELLRHRLPSSREHMITFIYMAYSIIALLYETVRAFEDTWVECLGDLSRYRMAIEDDNQRVRDTWTSVSRRWYTVASDRAPTTGRLYHHLAILARPYVVTQLYFYVKSLCVPIPFTSTRESIMTLLDPILNSVPQRVPPVELDFTKAHAILFTNRMQPQLAPTVARFLDALDAHIAQSAGAWTETGAHMGIVNSCALLNYGGDDNVLMKVLREAINRIATEGDDGDANDKEKQATAGDVPMADAPASAPTQKKEQDHKQSPEPPLVADPQILDALRPAQELVTEMDRVVFSRFGDANCNGYIHARLVWMLCMAGLPEGMIYVEHGFPWEELVITLNHMLLTCTNFDKIEQETLMQPQVDKKEEEEKKLKELQLQQQQQQQAAAAAGDAGNFFPTEPVDVVIPQPPPPRNNDDKPLPEDWSLRGLLWAEHNFPQGWFANMDSMDDEEKLMESASMTPLRKERILWMGCRLATHEKWIVYNAGAHQFSVTEAFRTAGGKGKASVPWFDGDEAEEDDADMGGDVDIENEHDSYPGLEDDNDDSDTADFDDDDEDIADDISLSDMEAIARAKISKFNKDTQSGPV